MRDVISDPTGFRLVDLAGRRVLPAFVKEASLDETQALDGLPSHMFADPAGRRYPCHTKAAAWLSLADYRDQAPQDRDSPIACNLRKFADYWEVENDPEQEETTKEAAAEGDIGWIDGIKAAADWLVEHRRALPFPQRHEIGRRIWAASLKEGADLGDATECVAANAAQGCCRVKEAAAALRLRAASQRDLDNASQYRRMADAIEGLTLDQRTDPQVYLKAAAAVDELDRAVDLPVGQAGLPVVEDIFFGSTFVKAAEYAQEHVRLPNGSVYRKADLQTLPTADLGAVLGVKFAEGLDRGLDIDLDRLVEKAAACEASDKFDQVCRLHGIKPVETNEAGRQRKLADVYFAAAR